jgi:hypothetical protein
MSADDGEASAGLRFGGSGGEASSGGVGGAQQMLISAQLAGEPQRRIDRGVVVRQIADAVTGRCDG